MSVYVDDMMVCVRNKNWRYSTVCHLIADTEEELHQMADQIGLRRSWFQKKNDQIPHYDLVRSKRVKVVRAGAVEISIKQFVKKLCEWRNNGKK